MLASTYNRHTDVSMGTNTRTRHPRYTLCIVMTYKYTQLTTSQISAHVTSLNFNFVLKDDRGSYICFKAMIIL